jgi:hypothetical protein
MASPCSNLTSLPPGLYPLSFLFCFSCLPPCDLFVGCCSLSRDSGLTPCDLRFSKALAFPFRFALLNLHFELPLLFAPWSMRLFFRIHALGLRLAVFIIFHFAFCNYVFSLLRLTPHDLRYLMPYSSFVSEELSKV